MLLNTLTNMLVKKLFGNDLVGRLVKCLLKSEERSVQRLSATNFPYYFVDKGVDGIQDEVQQSD